MTEQQLTTGAQLLRTINDLKMVFDNIKQSAAMTFGHGSLNPNYAPLGGVLLGKYTSDLSGEKAITINYRDDENPAPAWAVPAFDAAKAIILSALGAEINRLQKQFDEL